MSADMIEFDKDMLQLLDKATCILINEKIAGVLEINDVLFYIPDRDDNAALVKRVYDKQYNDAVMVKDNYYW